MQNGFIFSDSLLVNSPWKHPIRKHVNNTDRAWAQVDLLKVITVSVSFMPSACLQSESAEMEGNGPHLYTRYPSTISMTGYLMLERQKSGSSHKKCLVFSCQPVLILCGCDDNLLASWMMGARNAPTAARPYYLVEVNMNTRLPQLVDTILHEMAHVAHFCGFQRYRHLPCHFPLFGDRGHCAQWALAADRMLRIFQTMPLHLLPPTTRDFINRMGDFRWAVHLSVYA